MSRRAWRLSLGILAWIGIPAAAFSPVLVAAQEDTAYSIELNAAVAVTEWGGQRVRIMLEEDAFFDGERTRYIDGRQTRLWLIPR